MIDLHERLSEFSYGYGVTREIEKLLKSVGIHTAPFLPSLLQEAQLGFDVGFNKPGAVLLVQFKLGQSLRRFVRTSTDQPIPRLDRPFWRFKLNTAEPEGQYETLLKAERDGADAYYVAPRFVDWSEYLSMFENENVLANSVLVRPSDISNILLQQGEDDGLHRIAYDLHRLYVCSVLAQIPAVNMEQLISTVRGRATGEARPLANTVRQIFFGLETRYSVRREPRRPERLTEPGEFSYLGLGSRPDTRAERERRLESFRARARTEEDAIAASLGVEAWSLGIEMILAGTQRD